MRRLSVCCPAHTACLARLVAKKTVWVRTALRCATAMLSDALPCQVVCTCAFTVAFALDGSRSAPCPWWRHAVPGAASNDPATAGPPCVLCEVETGFYWAGDALPAVARATSLAASRARSVPVGLRPRKLAQRRVGRPLDRKFRIQTGHEHTVLGPLSCRSQRTPLAAFPEPAGPSVPRRRKTQETGDAGRHRHRLVATLS
ncbi:hypothetical protein, conserved in T. vivax [Trypanosoma vivax Y486]|uniref:Uncharacterized protein n=1 Tax=Trypanosoma vivax (strain Y486) TaxID=1055687 RepID=F9WTU9_TRYVY|nr:hypothetical protein, conserved in T. vivax [Trypanosoma vivax Y486]|eukprot:CCD20995.1 hypothetical protein, conserved in T. vivax [Trypanosoma vivax Y486]